MQVGRRRAAALGAVVLGTAVVAVGWSRVEPEAPRPPRPHAETAGSAEVRAEAGRASGRRVRTEREPIHIEPDAGPPPAPPPRITPAQSAAIDGWFAGIADRCPVDEDANVDPPATFAQEASEFPFVCEVFLSRRTRHGLVGDASRFRAEPFLFDVEPGLQPRADNELVAAVGARNSGWEVLFLLRDAEVVAAWTWFGAACPYVVVRGHDRWVECGEILRNLRGPASEARQSVRIPVTERRLRVRIEERKNEVTYLDDVYLERGSERLRPVNCPRAPYCLDDGSYARLSPGEFVVLDFEVPDRWVGHTALLFAEGHYRVRGTPPPPHLIELNRRGWPR